mmetsp:Transcript_95124/g.268736  ORF Transcript_95124/g.268736 Transcript_95124/m.268736 type:complete len:238 (+) Transcript_95124:1418-2131(+)
MHLRVQPFNFFPADAAGTELEVVDEFEDAAEPKEAFGVIKGIKKRHLNAALFANQLLIDARIKHVQELRRTWCPPLFLAHISDVIRLQVEEGPCKEAALANVAAGTSPWFLRRFGQLSRFLAEVPEPIRPSLAGQTSGSLHARVLDVPPMAQDLLHRRSQQLRLLHSVSAARPQSARGLCGEWQRFGRGALALILRNEVARGLAIKPVHPMAREPTAAAIPCSGWTATRGPRHIRAA